MPVINPSERKLNILVAEDNLINQKVAMMNLKQMGHDVEIAINGRMAVEMYKSGKYDLILMDLQMPVLDGISATIEIRKFERENKVTNPIKIIAITANVLTEDKNKCFEVGMDYFMTKPFRSEELIKALKS
ncbi:MAG: response regulator [Bacteroidetes bacterium]|nr:response regulator [Bacteroidota bacterium]